MNDVGEPMNQSIKTDGACRWCYGNWVFLATATATSMQNIVSARNEGERKTAHNNRKDAVDGTTTFA